MHGPMDVKHAVPPLSFHEHYSTHNILPQDQFIPSDRVNEFLWQFC